METIIKILSNLDKGTFSLTVYFATSVIDIILGFSGVVKEKGLNSSSFKHGVLKHLGILLVLIISYPILYVSIINESVAFTAVLAFVFQQVLSIIENLKTIGIDIGFLTKYFINNKK